MAIEKVQTRKVEVSPRALTEMVLSGVLFILAILLGYLSFARWRFKEALLSAYGSIDTNQPARALSEVQTALSWRSDHVGARLAGAKLLCDLDRLEEAEREYRGLLEGPFTGPAAYVGLGVVCLKRADRAASPGEVAPLLKRAKEAFGKAGGVPEGEIGMAHGLLLEAHSSGGGARAYEPARASFDRIGKTLSARQDYRSTCTREGLVDYYAGLGKALSESEAFDPAAASALRSWLQYDREAVLPRKNLMAVEARRFVETAFSNEQLTQMDPEIKAFRREFASGSLPDPLKEPWTTFRMALAYAWMRAGNTKAYKELAEELLRDDPSRDVLLFDALQWTNHLRRKDLQDPAPGITKGVQAYVRAAEHGSFQDEAFRGMRGTLLNNQAWLECWRGDRDLGPPGLQKARVALQRAITLLPDDYVVNRNMALVLKRLKRPASEIQPYLDKAKAGGTGAWAEDFRVVQQHVGAP